jgi:hypothetical protein
MTGDIARCILVQSHVIKLGRLAAETFDRETSLRLSALAYAIEPRTREADRLACSPKINEKAWPPRLNFG